MATLSGAEAIIPLPVGAYRPRTSLDGVLRTTRYAPVGEALNANPTFDSDVSNWSTVNGGGATHDTSTVQQGSGALLAERGSTDLCVRSEFVAVVPYVSYEIAGHHVGGTGSATGLTVEWYDENKAYLSDEGTLGRNDDTTRGYQFTRNVVTAPKGAAYARVGIMVEDASAETGYFDAVMLRACVPLVIDPLTLPDQGKRAGVGVQFTPNLLSHHDGSVRVFDMEGVGVAGSSDSMTRVFGSRHDFGERGLLLDNGIVRVGLLRGTNVQLAGYAEGLWDQTNGALLDFAGDEDPHVAFRRLVSMSPAHATVEVETEARDRARFTMLRGSPLVHVVATRTHHQNDWMDFQMSSDGSELVIHSGDTVFRDPVGEQNVPSAPSEPYLMGYNGGEPFLRILAFAEDASYFADGTSFSWRKSAPPEPHTAEFFVGLVPFPQTRRYVNESEDVRHTGTETADANASGGVAVAIDTQGESGGNLYITAGRDLPPGEYTMLVRARDSNQVAGDLKMTVRNADTGTDLNTGTFTCASTYGWFKLTFTVSASDDGAVMNIWVEKATTTTNTIYSDMVCIVPRKRTADTPASMVFPRDAARSAFLHPRLKETVRRVA